MSYEFNNWKWFFNAYKFIRERHKYNFPTYWIEVPISVNGQGWDELRRTWADLVKLAPDNREQMSIYGVITFEVTKDENLNIINSTKRWEGGG